MNRKVKRTKPKLLSIILGMLIFLSGVVYMGAPMVAHAAAEQWVDVGSAGFSSGDAVSTNIAVDSSGTPFVVYIDEGNSYKATVMKYNGSSWENVGSAGFSSGSVESTSIAIDISSTPYVVYRDLGNANKATVMKYNGSSWETVGSAGFSAGSVESISIAIDSIGTPYVVYIDVGNDYRATVMKYNGSSWENVGSAGFTSGEASYTSIAINSIGTPYVVYMDGNNSFKATVMKYGGSSWEIVGSAGFSSSSVTYTNIAIDGNGTPYVVYKDSGNSNKATVMKYNGSLWENVGSAGFSAGVASYTNIAIDSNETPYIVYQDAGNSSKATVMKYNGSSWENVGSAGYSAGTVYYTSIAIDSNGTPYVVYQDISNNTKATVKKLTMKYTVTYDGNVASSGNVPTDSNTYHEGGTTTVLGNTLDLVKTGYMFAGWNTQADGTGTDYVAGDPISIGSADVTMYAKWAINAATPSIDTQPTGATVNEGASAPLSVAATVSDSGTLSYQWYSNTTSSTSGGTAINGATSATYAAPTTTVGTTYCFVVVTNTNSSATGSQTATATSSAVTVTVNALTHAATPSINTQPANQTVNEGASAPLSVAATLSDIGMLSYQWYSNTTGSNSGGTAINGATSVTYAAPTTTSGTTYYYVVVTNTNISATGSQTATTTSEVATVTVNALTHAATPSINTQPANQTVNEGASAPLSVAATVSDSGMLSYQWYSNTTSSNSGGTAINGSTSAMYAAPTTTVGMTYYYVVVTNTNSSATGSQTATATSEVATVTVNALTHAVTPSIGTQPANQTVNEGASAPLSVAATLSDSGMLSYQWYSNTTGSNSGGTAINGATSATYTAPTTTSGTTYYYVVVTNTNGSATGSQTATATSSAVTVTVNALTHAATPSIGTEPTGATVNEGASAPLSVAATVSDSGMLSYQWYSNTTSSNSGGTAINGATSATYAAPTITSGTTYYYVVVTNTNGSATGSQTATATSSAVTVTVNAAVISTPLAPTGLTAIAGNGQIDLAWNGVSGTVTYSVYEGTASGSYGLTPIATVIGTTNSFTATGLTNDVTYYFAVKASNAGGNSSFSDEVSATPKATPNASSNANLSSMSISGLTLSPSFDPGTVYYTASVANGVTLVTVTPIISDSNAKVKVNGTAVTGGQSSEEISLNVGNNMISVEVTAQDDISMQTYTVNVTRAEIITASSSAPIQVTNQPVTIVVPASVTNAEIAVATTTSGSNKEATLPLVEVLTATTLGNVSVMIPDGTKITAPAIWDGTIKLPQVLSNGSVSINGGTASAVIEVGSTDVSITFDRAVRLLFPNQGGKKAGFIQNGVLTEITGMVTADTQTSADNEIAAGGDAKITVGNDLVIWTKHFTQFVSYTPVNTTSNTNTGGGSGGTATNSATIVAANGGTITLNGATIEAPAGVMDSNIQITVDIVSDAATMPMDSALQLVSKVYEIKKDKAGQFNKPIVITIPYDMTKVDFTKLTIGVYWLNEQTQKWVLLDSQKVDNANGTASGSVNHFTKFAVLALDKAKTEQPQTNEVDFADIIGHWSEASVRELVKLGAISGYLDNTFKPNASITRAEFVTVIVKAFHLEVQDGIAFADTETHWAKNAITTVASAGIVAGYSDNSFEPNSFITREQMAAIVVRAAKLAAADKSINFSDSSDISEWARTALATAIANGLINGYEDDTVKPKVNTTRAEAVTVILKAIQVNE
jgi:uncharacterized repeat protein (TIGR02543 family)